MTEGGHFTIAPAAWDPDFCDRSPLFEPLRSAARNLPKERWPECADLQSFAGLDPPLRVHNGSVMRFVPQSADVDLGYEEQTYRRGEVRVRARDWHDLFNALVWRTFPRAKAALNRAHYEAMQRARAAHRGPRRDALTLFDESGVIVAATDGALLQAVREFRWHDLFWRDRDPVRNAMRFFIFGHALYQKALQPYVGLTGQAVLLTVDERFLAATPTSQMAELDGRVAECVDNETDLSSPRMLTPLPLLGVPGWWPANEDEAFYRNAHYFRPGRRGATTARVPT